jgi:hypothetical protein
MIGLDPLWRLLRTSGETIAAVPDVVKAVLVLPTLAEQLAQVCRNTDALPGMVVQLEQIERDTGVLPEMRDEFVVVRTTTVHMRGDTQALGETLEQLAQVAEPLEGAARRLGRLTDRLPQRNGH